MARIRTIYGNEALLVGPSPATGAQPATGIKRIHRVQTLGNTFDYGLETVNEYGKANAIDRINLEGTTNTVEFSYLAVDFENEKNLGFTIGSNTSAIADILNKSQDDRNYYRFVAPEGLDAEGLAASAGAVMAVGNGFLSSYSFEAAVGAFPTATISVSGLNTATYLNGVAQDTPAVDPTTGRKAAGAFTLPTIAAPSDSKPTVIQPGGVKVVFSNPDAGVFQSLAPNDLIVQSASVSFDLNLEEIRGLGSRLVVSREVEFPVDVTVTIEALMSDLQEANLVNLLCEEEPTDITINLYTSDCDEDGPVLDDIYAKIIVKNTKITNQDLSGTIGPSHTVSMTFLGQIGAANDSGNGVSFSGVYGYSGSTPLFSA